MCRWLAASQVPAAQADRVAAQLCPPAKPIRHPVHVSVFYLFYKATGRFAGRILTLSPMGMANLRVCHRNLANQSLAKPGGAAALPGGSVKMRLGLPCPWFS